LPRATLPRHRVPHRVPHAGTYLPRLILGFPVAELNLPSARSGKFSWDLKPTEVAEISRKHRSDPPDFHLQLGAKGDDTVPLTSTRKIVDPINVPLPESPGVSWESQNSLKSNSKLEVIDKQPSPFTSPILTDDKPPNYTNTAFATDVVLDLHALLSNVNVDNINAPAAIEADLIAAAPVAQNLQGIELDIVAQGPVAQNLQGVDAGVGIVPQIQPAPVVQGPVDVPPAILLPPDGDNNNNDSSEDETDIIMTDSEIAPPTFNGKAAQDPSDWMCHFILYCTFKRYIPERQKSLFKVLLTDGAAD